MSQQTERKHTTKSLVEELGIFPIRFVLRVRVNSN